VDWITLLVAHVEGVQHLIALGMHAPGPLSISPAVLQSLQSRRRLRLCLQADVLGPSSLDPVQATTPLMRRSFDDLTPCHQRKKRTPQQEQLAEEISQNLDSLDLSGLPSKQSSGKKVWMPAHLVLNQQTTRGCLQCCSQLSSPFVLRTTFKCPGPSEANCKALDQDLCIP